MSLLDDDQPPSYDSIMRVDAQTAVVGNVDHDEPPVLQRVDVNNDVTTALPKLLCACMLVTEIVGVGILALPYGMTYTGWAGLGIICFLGLGMFLTSVELSNCWDIYIVIQPTHNSTFPIRPNEAMAQEAFGLTGRIIVIILQILTLFAVISTYLLASADILYSLFCSIWPHDYSCYWVFFLGCVLTPCTFYGSPKRYWSSSSYGVFLILVVLYCMTIIELTFDKSPNDPLNLNFTNVTISTYMLGVGIIMFSVCGPHAIPGCKRDLIFAKQHPHAFDIAIFTTLMANLLIGGLSYLILGDGVTKNILINLHSQPNIFIESLALIYLCYSILVTVDLLINPVEEFFNPPGSDSNLRKIVIRLLIMALIVLFCLVVFDYTIIIIIVGLTTIPVLAFIFPIVCCVQLERRRHASEIEPSSSPRWQTFIRIIFILFCCITIPAMWWFAISEVLLHNKYGNVCF